MADPKPLYLSKRDETLGITRDQRLVAAIVLTAIDLPAELAAFSQHLIDAATVCPGITMDEVSIASRRAGFVKAREMLDRLIDGCF